MFAGLYGLPPRHGKLKDLTKFDADYFGVHPKQAHYLDPQVRNLLELTYEAIVDSGKLATLMLYKTLLHKKQCRTLFTNVH